ncbi:MAG: nucleotidyltransferase domain-containing protein [Candidatus Nanoarchaeia archaeon]|nr:nucleotidyltransferase domain-containing protein [Candidatus Nanoarchaeia archaeon]MDD5587933.1 nucleotidyltransferase domain-containing protein [Candidatus Nanoarchaeia archaeon]
MVYTEIKNRNGKQYFYRVLSIRNKDKVSKKRIYLGKNLTKEELLTKELQVNQEFNSIKKNVALEKLKPKIIKILKKYKIGRAGIFGSYAIGKQKKNSDIDILIEPTKHMGLEFFGLQIELEEKLKKKVDLVTYNSIHPLLKERIFSEEVKII